MPVQKESGADAGPEIDVEEIVDANRGAGAVLREGRPIDVVVDDDELVGFESERGAEVGDRTRERGVGQLPNDVGGGVDRCSHRHCGGQSRSTCLLAAPRQQDSSGRDGGGQILVRSVASQFADRRALVVEGADGDIPTFEHDADAVAVIGIEVVEQRGAAAITGSLADFDDDPGGDQTLCGLGDGGLGDAGDLGDRCA